MFCCVEIIQRSNSSTIKETTKIFSSNREKGGSRRRCYEWIYTRIWYKNYYLCPMVYSTTVSSLNPLTKKFIGWSTWMRLKKLSLPNMKEVYWWRKMWFYGSTKRINSERNSVHKQHGDKSEKSSQPWSGIRAYGSPITSQNTFFMVWLAVRNILSTGDRMLSWNDTTLSSCYLYPEPLETRDHIFFACPYATEIWRPLKLKLLQSQYTIQWDIVLDILVDTSQGKLKLFLLKYVFQISIHSIWRDMNGRRHGEPATPHAQVTKYIDKQVRNRLSMIRTIEDDRYEEGMKMWFATR